MNERARAIQALLSGETPDIEWRVLPIKHSGGAVAGKFTNRSERYVVTANRTFYRVVADAEDEDLRRLARDIRLGVRLRDD